MKQLRTRIKFCGMTSVTDAVQAVSLGVDAIGLIFHPASSRNVTPDQAKKIAESLPPFINRVGVFVNRDKEVVDSILARVPLDTLQFHGQEPADFCRSFHKPYLKVIHIGEDPLILNYDDFYPDAHAFLFDTQLQHLAGGGGQVFNWDLLPKVKKPFILAGGLSSDNVAEAIAKTNPYAVDVTSGIEKDPGIKDPIRMQKFVDAIYSYNHCTGDI
jgi:phosphoribosylanthranilate isomerase